MNRREQWDRLVELAEQYGNAEAAGLCDESSDPEMHEAASLITALDGSGAVVIVETGRGILGLTPGTPAHAARVAARGATDAEREGL